MIDAYNQLEGIKRMPKIRERVERRRFSINYTSIEKKS